MQLPLTGAKNRGRCYRSEGLLAESMLTPFSVLGGMHPPLEPQDDWNQVQKMSGASKCRLLHVRRSQRLGEHERQRVAVCLLQL